MNGRSGFFNLREKMAFLLLLWFLLTEMFHDCVVFGAAPTEDLCMRSNIRPASSDVYRCGDDHCWCTNVTASCRNIHYNPEFAYPPVPELPETVRYLDLSRDRDQFGVPGIDTPKFFANAAKITHLSLAGNAFCFTSQGLNAFSMMKNLTCVSFDRFYFDRNQLLGQYDYVHCRETISTHFDETARPITYLVQLFKSVLNIPTLRQFSASSCGLPDLIVIENASSVETLKLSSNPLPRQVDLTKYSNLKSLKELFLARCRIERIHLTCALRLQKLHLEQNDMRYLPNSCNKRRSESVFPSLEYLNMANNNIQFVDGLVGAFCFPRLRTLDLSGNGIVALDGSFVAGPVSSQFPDLDVLIIDELTPPDYYRNKVSVCQNMFMNYGQPWKSLSMAHNDLDFSKKDDIGSDCFAHCLSLQELILDGNNFLHVDDDRFLALFGHLKLLTTLSLRYCQIEGFSTRTFGSFPNLSILYLTGNRILTVPNRAFDWLPMLHSLDLSGNQIKIVGKYVFSEDTRQRLSSLRLGNNSFLCTCDLLWFRQWLVSNPSIFYLNKSSSSGYKCRNLHETKVEEFQMMKQACLLPREVNLQIIMTCSFLILALTLVTLVFRYRWHIRLVLHDAFRGKGDHRRLRLQTDQFEYDVFVSYSSEQLPWVRQHLMPELEDRLGLRLCVHERDFIPGNNIVDNIAECVESSKKILMVFSKDFVHSQWCQFELTYCLRHVMDYDDALIIVCVDDVASRDMTTAMMAVLKTTTYIQWAELDDAVESFWGRLHLALHEVMEPADQNV